MSELNNFQSALHWYTLALLLISCTLLLGLSSLASADSKYYAHQIVGHNPVGWKDGASLAEAQFDRPNAIRFHPSTGDMYIAELSGTIRKISATTGAVSTIYRSINSSVFDLTIGNDSFIYFTDVTNYVVRRVHMTSKQTEVYAGQVGVSFYRTAYRLGATFTGVRAISFNLDYTCLYVTDTDTEHPIRPIIQDYVYALEAHIPIQIAGIVGSRASAVSTYVPIGYSIQTLMLDPSSNLQAVLLTALAGNSTVSAHADGTGDVARFTEPKGLAVDDTTDTIIFIADVTRIRRLNHKDNNLWASNVVSTLTFSNPEGSMPTFSSLVGIAKNTSAPAESGIYVTEPNTSKIWKIDICNYVWFKDADGDGYGDPNQYKCTTDAGNMPAGYVADNTDCNDTSSSIHLGAQEICDLIDNNCNGQIDEGFPIKNRFYSDLDGDGLGNPLDYIDTCLTSPPAGYVANRNDCYEYSVPIEDATCNDVGSSRGTMTPSDLESETQSEYPGSVEENTIFGLKMTTFAIVAGSVGAGVLLLVVLLVVIITVCTVLGRRSADRRRHREERKHVVSVEMTPVQLHRMSTASSVAYEIMSGTSSSSSAASDVTRSGRSHSQLLSHGHHNNSGGRKNNHQPGHNAHSPQQQAQQQQQRARSDSAASAVSTASDVSAAVAAAGSIHVDPDDIKKQVKIGQGSFGIVFKAELYGEMVAVKHLTGIATIHDEETKNRITEEFVNEVKILASMKHPNVLSLRGAVVAYPKLCIITEYCALGTLSSFLFEKKLAARIPWPHKLKLTTDMALGLLYIHKQRIIHRDLKSANILLSGDPEVDFDDPFRCNVIAKVADLGLAKIKAKSVDGEQLSAINTMQVGTALWMAPEVSLGDRYNQSADVFSFGIIMSEILSEKLPYFDQPRRNNINFRITVEKELRPTILIPAHHNASREMYPKSHEMFIGLMKKCWKFEPDERPPMDAVVRELKAMQEVARSEFSEYRSKTPRSARLMQSSARSKRHQQQQQQNNSDNNVV